MLTYKVLLQGVYAKFKTPNASAHLVFLISTYDFSATRQRHIGLYRIYKNYLRIVFNAVVQGITWSSIWLTESACTAAGLKSVPFSKSVNNDNAGCTRTCATSNSLKMPRKCSGARAPPTEPYDTIPAALLFHSFIYVEINSKIESVCFDRN